MDDLKTAPNSRAAVWGVGFGVMSALGYSSASIFLRAVHDCDPFWVSFVKATPTVVMVTPWLVFLYRQGVSLWPTASVFRMIALTSLWANVGGNVAFQWSLGVIGIALTVPLTLGSMIISGAILGRVLLGEPVSLRAAAAAGVLLVSIFVLSLGAGDAFETIRPTIAASQPGKLAWGVLAACCAGIAYASLGVAIRRGLQLGAKVSTTLFISSTVGLVCLSAMSYQTVGWAGMRATPWLEWQWMLLAGVCNALAFLALTKALQTTSVVVVNGVNASQAAICAAAGVALFGEALSWAMAVGSVLTVLGLLMMAPPRTKRTNV